MYCKRCGKVLLDDARFCSYCGEPVVTPVEEDKPHYHFQPDPEFVWNVDGFPAPEPKKTEDIEFSWSNDTEKDRRPRSNTEEELFRGFVKQNEQEIDAQVAPEPDTLKEEEKIMDDPDEILETIKADTAAAEKNISEQEKKIDKFYTFNKKNEEFQKLLDREYEKIRRGLKFDLEPENNKEQEDPEAEPENTPVQEVPIQQEAEVKDIKKEEPYEEPYIKEETLICNNEELRRFDTRELNRDLMEIAIAKTGLDPSKFVVDAEKDRPERKEIKSGFKPMFLVEQEAEAKTSETDILQEESSKETVDAVESNTVQAEEAEKKDRTDGRSISSEETASNAEKGAEASDEKRKPETVCNAAEELPWIQRDIDWEKKRALDALWGTMEIEGISKPQEAAEDKKEERVLASEASETVSQEAFEEKTDQKPDEEQKDKKDDIKILQDEISRVYDDTEDDEEDDEDEGRAGGFIKFLLGLIIILLVMELAILGIRFFAPDSKAGVFVEEKLGTMTEWFFDLTNGDSDKNTDDNSSSDTLDSQDTDNNNDTTENQDNGKESESLLQSQMHDRTDAEAMSEYLKAVLPSSGNIQSLSYDGQLAWKAGHDYGLSDLNDSKPIEDNYWYTENDEVHSYDKEAVKALVDFNSAWIEFVNTGDKAVLDMTKKDSTAYKNITNYSKAGKLKENFEVLKIGEVRQGAKGFYVWAHEEIQKTEGGSTKVAKYDYVYYMEPIDNRMKIVKYITI